MPISSANSLISLKHSTSIYFLSKIWFYFERWSFLIALSFVSIYCFKLNIFCCSLNTSQLDWCGFFYDSSCDFSFTIFYTWEMNCCLCIFACSTFWKSFLSLLFSSTNFRWIYVNYIDYSNNFSFVYQIRTISKRVKFGLFFFKFSMRSLF